MFSIHMPVNLVAHLLFEIIYRVASAFFQCAALYGKHHCTLEGKREAEAHNNVFQSIWSMWKINIRTGSRVF